MRHTKRVFEGWRLLWWSRSTGMPFPNVLVVRDEHGCPWSIGEVWRSGRRWKGHILHPTGPHPVRATCFDSISEVCGWIEQQWTLLGGAL